MLFNSPEFLVFLAVVYTAYRLLPFRLQNYMLVGAGYFFYGWWDWRFVFLMTFSTTMDFWVGLTMDRGKLALRERVIPSAFLVATAAIFLGLRPKSWLLGEGPPVAWPTMGWAVGGALAFLVVAYTVYQQIIRLPEDKRRFACLMVSVITQIGILSTFKYFNFFVDSLTTVIQQLGFSPIGLHLSLILPVGLSFYTFQSLSYAMDIYRREIKPTDRFSNFALFVAFFPLLVAGPIERARHLLPQLSNPRTIRFEDSTRGLYLIVLGLFKKVAIADGVAPVVDQIYGSSGHISWTDVVVGTLLFAVQIYCDFSGYSDIARGVAKLFGVDVMVNFNQPYFSKNPREFWQRWHISLSTWLSDYLYKPLGGNRGSLAFTCRNLMTTMILGGLWHGAAWNYVFWGFYQGGLLCVHRVWTAFRRPANPSRPALVNLALIAIFFVFTCYGWLLFRAHSFDQITTFTSILVTGFGDFSFGASMPRISAFLGIGLLSLMEIAQYWSGDAHYYRRFGLPAQGLMVAAMIFITFMGMSNEPAQFIYFQF
jgi:D-alanyl-lipoteichoic acid acyltransferase DltB (MBOAT superfamily)